MTRNEVFELIWTWSVFDYTNAKFGKQVRELLGTWEDEKQKNIRAGIIRGHEKQKQAAREKRELDEYVKMEFSDEDLDILRKIPVSTDDPWDGLRTFIEHNYE